MTTAVQPIESILSAGLRNASVPQLYELALQSGLARLAVGGPLVVSTGEHTGRSPKDRYIVEQPATLSTVDWNEINQPISQTNADRLRAAVLDHLGGHRNFVQDLSAGADPTYQLPIRIVTSSAWHALFAETMFIRPSSDARTDREPAFTILHAPDFEPNPADFGLRNSTFIVVDIDAGSILIGGTHYAGEIKKSIFSVMNFLLPERRALPMHCSCNVGDDNDVALFFGLSGTGKTTLSADPQRILIGDDEHGWSEQGVFNFEGGCYAKVIALREEHEPEIFATTRMFGTILENVVLDPATRTIDFDDARITQNTRAAYPISSIPNASITGLAGQPSNVIMLTADAFGVLPPVARLSTDQALYYFLSGYTSKIAGTEIGIDEPVATFSSGFGAPFLPRRPAEYAALLAERLEATGAQTWLVNTGWTGGPYGIGRRMPIDATRAIISAILDNTLLDAEWVADPPTGLSIPTHCPGVPDGLLAPRDAWSNMDEYDEMAARLSRMFAENFAQFVPQVSVRVAAAGPHRV